MVIFIHRTSNLSQQIESNVAADLRSMNENERSCIIFTQWRIKELNVLSFWVSLRFIDAPNAPKWNEIPHSKDEL